LLFISLKTAILAGFHKPFFPAKTMILSWFWLKKWGYLPKKSLPGTRLTITIGGSLLKGSDYQSLEFACKGVREWILQGR